jgi:hypothetical protein
MSLSAALSMLALIGLAGCGGASPEPEPAPRDPGPDLWSGKTFVEKHARMTFTFLPNMSRRFQRFADTEYPELACVTCHGMDAEEVDYRMPNGLPPLDPNALPDADDSSMARFMIEVVVPQADRLMQAGGRVDCFSCHPRTEGSS